MSVQHRKTIANIWHAAAPVDSAAKLDAVAVADNPLTGSLGENPLSTPDKNRRGYLVAADGERCEVFHDGLGWLVKLGPHPLAWVPVEDYRWPHVVWY